MKKFLFITISVLLLMSCKKDKVEIDTNDSSFNFYPLAAGTERVYKVTTISVDKDVDLYDTTIYYLKETVMDTIIDTLDYKMFLIKRDRRVHDTLSWEYDKQVAIKKYKRRLGFQEDNQEISILQFTERNGMTWDANEFNSLDMEEYEYTETSTKDSILNELYDSVLVVLVEDTENKIERIFNEYRYQYGVGLVSQTDIDVGSQGDGVQLIGPVVDRITFGTIFKKELMSVSIPE